MGDFIHSLILPKYVFDVTGEKFNIYICNHSQEVFASGIDTSYRDLLPLMENQPYINSFEIWDNQHIDINLTGFRDYPNLYEVSWNEFYLWNYIGTDIKVPFNYSWINIEKDNTYKDLLLINRNMKPIPNQEIEKHYLNYI